MKFGLNERKKLTGAELYIKIYQICSVLPVIYILILSGYPALITKKGVISYLFEIGMSSISKPEEIALSLIYKKSLSEIIFVFILLIFALIFGIVGGRLLKKDERISKTVHYVFIALIGIDLIAKTAFAIALGFEYGIVPWLVGFIIRAACLALVILDILAWKKRNA